MDFAAAAFWPSIWEGKKSAVHTTRISHAQRGKKPAPAKGNAARGTEKSGPGKKEIHAEGG
jgi:hypothetical protein